MGAMRAMEERPDCSIDEAAASHCSDLRWDRELKNNLRRRKTVAYAPDRIWTTQYRPFVKQHCYVDYTLVNNKYLMDQIFTAADTDNRTICVPGIGSTKPFSVLITDAMPDLNMLAAGAQCFPRYRYEKGSEKQGALLADAQDLRRIDNISDVALRAVQVHYSDHKITKDAIFDYVYGLLHAPAYGKRFANDLAKGLPRIPFAKDFHAFAEAGRELAALHLGYESCEEYPLETVFSGSGEPRSEHFKLSSKKMRFAEEKTVLIINEHISLNDIPPEAHQYEVNGRSPIDWFMDRYFIKRDPRSGILNDPNGWFKQPEDLVTAFRRIVHVSVETVRLVVSLPDAGI